MEIRHLIDGDYIRFNVPEGPFDAGVQPAHYTVLVVPDEVIDTTESGLALPPETIKKAQWNQTEGRIVSIGKDAFDDWLVNPNVGDKVVFARHEGQTVIGNDDREYKLLNDKSIIGVRKED